MIEHEGKLACPGCGYELGDAPGDQAACPECGGKWSKSGLKAQRGAVVRLGFLLVGWGAIGTLVARSIGAMMGLMPVAMDGRGGSPVTAATRLQVAPLIAVAAGVVTLAVLSAQGKRVRMWPALAAVACGVVALHAATLVQTASHPDHPIWLQPQTWTASRDWLGDVSRCVLALGGAWVAYRIAASRRWAWMRRLAMAAALAAGLGVVFQAGAEAHRRYKDGVQLAYQQQLQLALPQRRSPSPPAATMPTPPPYHQTVVATNALNTIGGFMERGAWAGLGLLGIAMASLHGARRGEGIEVPDAG